MAEANRQDPRDDEVVGLCAELIKFDTTNRGGGDAEGERAAAEYVADRLTAAGLEPKLLERTAGRTNVVARLTGTDPSLGALLVQGHLDVVPADPADWRVPPFSGAVQDECVWGRGAVDMKDFCAIVLTVLARWARDGVRPRRDIVFAFVADEEDRGVDGAHWLVDEHPELFDGCVAAISESGGYTYRVPRPDGDALRVYPVGTAERGTAHLRLTARGRAGHGSRVNADNAVTTLVRALARLSEQQWPLRITPSVRVFFERVGTELGVPVDTSSEAGVSALLEALGPAAGLVESTVRNSTTPTMLSAGYKVNVVPAVAQAQVDTRVLPGTEDELLRAVDELLGPGVSREFVSHSPPVQATVDSPWVDAMAEAIRAEDSAAVVVPYCLGGGTDAKAFSQLGIDCFGFSPLWLPEGFPYRELAHGVDERVPVAGLRFGVRVLDRFLSG
ncbi:acetylornithine deacetylase/succinyl-diaminopimelate desuccinylase-like protein [Tamaricihabitans halophyticus]|uniref:Acetylornithine deacetylase/succinyl-diaminopimelate desuccinylase-like protein n=1 Tax=Tamaricihabitans halophyticus TaxID=1262583 RepID=A0A4R2QN22_9PSEU|nr:M20/M25/M40 family metallo-hydrolase [Tamaricihabitans halophyticus]TCP50983.1 acetylornithine deacetylase/succinyl-diaminopimelate desuccinylase-like protein [Tamaricihabitans halophyticus]